MSSENDCKANNLEEKLRSKILPMIEKAESAHHITLSQGNHNSIVDEICSRVDSLITLMNKQREEIVASKDNIGSVQKELNSVLKILDDKERELQEAMITDKLTKLFNRQYLVTVLEDEIARCQRYGRPVAIIMIDIDDFRVFNASFGSKAGDSMLSFVGSLIKENTRKFDRAFRYGGEEFVIILPESDLTMAYIAAERIRSGFENGSFPVIKKENGLQENVSGTISIGITATYAFNTEGVSIETLISQAEAALSQAKDRGGNISIRHEQ